MCGNIVHSRYEEIIIIRLANLCCSFKKNCTSCVSIFPPKLIIWSFCCICACIPHVPWKNKSIQPEFLKQGTFLFAPFFFSCNATLQFFKMLHYTTAAQQHDKPLQSKADCMLQQVGQERGALM